MKLHQNEKEFHIGWVFDSPYAEVSITSSPNDKVYRDLKELIETHPDTYVLQEEKIDSDGESAYIRVQCPKKYATHLSTPRAKRELTDEQHEALVQRAKLMQQKHKQNNNV